MCFKNISDNMDLWKCSIQIEQNLEKKVEPNFFLNQRIQFFQTYFLLSYMFMEHPQRCDWLNFFHFKFMFHVA